MVERKTSIFDYEMVSTDDTASNPPMVAASPIAPEESEANILRLDAVPVEALPAHASDPLSNNDNSAETTVEEQAREAEQDRTIGAGVAAGVVGLFLGGPFLSVIFGFGTAYATQQEGTAGDVARSVGDIALTAQARAKELNQKHKLVDRTKEAASQAWEKAKKVNQDHHVMERATEMMVRACTATAAFIQRHRLIERGVDGIGKAVHYLMERISQKLEEDSAVRAAAAEAGTAPGEVSHPQATSAPTTEPTQATVERGVQELGKAMNWLMEQVNQRMEEENARTTASPSTPQTRATTY